MFKPWLRRGTEIREEARVEYFEKLMRLYRVIG
jgi:hypothetical protein